MGRPLHWSAELPRAARRAPEEAHEASWGAAKAAHFDYAAAQPLDPHAILQSERDVVGVRRDRVRGVREALDEDDPEALQHAEAEAEVEAEATAQTGAEAVAAVQVDQETEKEAVEAEAEAEAEVEAEAVAVVHLPVAFAALVADEQDEQLDHRDHQQADVKHEHGELGGTLETMSYAGIHWDKENLLRLRFAPRIELVNYLPSLYCPLISRSGTSKVLNRTLTILPGSSPS